MFRPLNCWKMINLIKVTNEICPAAVVLADSGGVIRCRH